MADLNTINQTATAADKAIHSLIFDVAVRAAESEIIAMAPAMGWPILKQIDEAILNFVAGKIYEKLSLGATFAIIDSQTSIEAKVANDAAASLRSAIQIGDQDAINHATTDFKSAFGKLVHLDGSAAP